MATDILRTETKPGSIQVATGSMSLFNVVRSEWTKLWSVRSTYWTILTMFVLTVGLSALLAATIVSSEGEEMAYMLLDPTATSLSGISLGQLAIVVLGVMAITTEYSTGSVRTSLIAVPRRLRFLSAKAIVLAPVALVTGTVTSFAAFYIGQAILATAGASAELSDPNVLRAVIGGGLFLGASAMFGFAVGALLRSTASGITIAVAGLLVLPQITGQLPGSWGEWLHKTFTSNAGQQIFQVTPMSDQLGPWAGYAVFTAWWVAILIVASALMIRRDA